MPRQHRARLHRAGVGAQDQAGVLGRHEEGVHHRAGRVVAADVERVEVQPLRLELGPVGDLVAHAHEDVGDPLGERGQRVPGAARDAVPRQRDVDPLLGQHPRVPLGLQLGQPGGVGRGDRLAGGVDPLAGVRAGRGRQRSQLAAGQQDRRAVAQVGRPDGGQRLQVAGRRERLLRGAHRVVESLGRERGDLLGVVGIIGARHGRPFCPVAAIPRARVPVSWPGARTWAGRRTVRTRGSGGRRGGRAGPVLGRRLRRGGLPRRAGQPEGAGLRRRRALAAGRAGRAPRAAPLARRAGHPRRPGLGSRRRDPGLDRAGGLLPRTVPRRDERDRADHRRHRGRRPGARRAARRQPHRRVGGRRDPARARGRRPGLRGGRSRVAAGGPAGERDRATHRRQPRSASSSSCSTARPPTPASRRWSPPGWHRSSW